VDESGVSTIVRFPPMLFGVITLLVLGTGVPSLVAMNGRTFVPKPT